LDKVPTDDEKNRTRGKNKTSYPAAVKHKVTRPGKKDTKDERLLKKDQESARDGKFGIGSYGRFSREHALSSNGREEGRVSKDTGGARG